MRGMLRIIKRKGEAGVTSPSAGVLRAGFTVGGRPALSRFLPSIAAWSPLLSSCRKLHKCSQERDSRCPEGNQRVDFAHYTPHPLSAKDV